MKNRSRDALVQEHAQSDNQLSSSTLKSREGSTLIARGIITATRQCRRVSGTEAQLFCDFRGRARSPSARALPWGTHSARPLWGFGCIAGHRTRGFASLHPWLSQPATLWQNSRAAGFCLLTSDFCLLTAAPLPRPPLHAPRSPHPAPRTPLHAPPLHAPPLHAPRLTLHVPRSTRPAPRFTHHAPLRALRGVPDQCGQALRDFAGIAVPVFELAQLRFNAALLLVHGAQLR